MGSCKLGAILQAPYCSIVHSLMPPFVTWARRALMYRHMSVAGSPDGELRSAGSPVTGNLFSIPGTPAVFFRRVGLR